MTKLSPTHLAIARNSHMAILRALADKSQKAVAEASGVSETKLSRLKDEQLEQYCLALVAAGLKIVPIDAEVVTPCEKRFMAEKMIEHYSRVIDEMDKPF